MQRLTLTALALAALAVTGARADDSPAWSDRTDSPNDFLLHARPDRASPSRGPAERRLDMPSPSDRRAVPDTMRRDAPVDPARRETGNNT